MLVQRRLLFDLRSHVPASSSKQGKHSNESTWFLSRASLCFTYKTTSHLRMTAQWVFLASSWISLATKVEKLLTVFQRPPLTFDLLQNKQIFFNLASSMFIYRRLYSWHLLPCLVLKSDDQKWHLCKVHFQDQWPLLEAAHIILWETSSSITIHDSRFDVVEELTQFNTFKMMHQHTLCASYFIM